MHKHRGGIELKVWKAVQQHRRERLSPNDIDHDARMDQRTSYDYDESVCKCTNGEIADNLCL